VSNPPRPPAVIVGRRERDLRAPHDDRGKRGRVSRVQGTRVPAERFPSAGPAARLRRSVPRLLEVPISLPERARCLATWIAIAATAACSAGLQPTIPPTPAAGSRASRPATGAAADGGTAVSAPTTATGASVTAAPRPADSVVIANGVPDSLATALRDAIEKVSALFDVPDSVVRGHRFSYVDVDSTSGVGDGGEPTWDIEVDSYVTQDKVAHYVNLFLGSARTRFVERLQRGKQYEPMIREKFRAAGIPEDMYFLGLVESGYDPHAYSRAAAVGMWQFMSSTARGVGLRVDWWVDERRDPMKSTDAAARFIRDLRAQFGSLYLAAAAYNGGPGRVSRGLKKFDGALEEVSGEDCFFALAEQDYLRAETKNYVPQLIAAALIGKAPARYGIQLDSVPRYAYDSVFVPAGTPLASVARAVGHSLRDVQSLNPHVLRGVTPPDVAIPVRIPAGAAAGFDSSWAALPDSERVAFRRVTTRKGETLAGLARKHGVQSRHLSWFNRKLSVRKGRLTAGQVVLVPTAAVVAGAFDVPDPSIERYGTSAGGGRVTHVVRRGESLGLIAKRYRTTVPALVRLNRLKRNVIYPGQTIIVRGAPRAASSSAARRSPRSATRSAASARPTSSGAKASSSRKPAASKKSTASRKATTSTKSSAIRKPTTSKASAAARGAGGGPTK